MSKPIRTILVPAALLAGLAACGGGDPGPAAADATTTITADAAHTETASAAVSRADLTDAQRAAAATATASNTSNNCNVIRPFYWEVGNSSGAAVTGSLTAVGSSAHYTASIPITVASASKWLYGAYFVQKNNAVLSDTDRKFLAMRAGYISFSGCTPSQTVDSCLAYQSNGVYTASADGKFFYGGGHMQKHASLNGLGAMNDSTLTAAVQAQVGADVPLTYTQPQLAGGLAMTPSAYATALRKMMTGALKIGSLLGTDPVCTNPVTCGTGNALFTPIPATESWHYSVAHWVEDDPVTGDGSFSSPGAFGFYPWIDASKTIYGIVARVAQNGAWPSVLCGRMIRKAWQTGVAQ